MIDIILSRLARVRPCGDGYVALCPAHEDGSPSLSIRDTGDKVLLHCHAGCETADILAAIGLEWSDVFAEEQRRERCLTAGARRSIARSLLYDATFVAQDGGDPDLVRESYVRLNACRRRYGDTEFRRILATLDAPMGAVT